MAGLNRLKLCLLGIIGTVGLLAVWSVIEPRILNIEQETASIPQLPTAWQGEQIGLISDLQIGMWWGNPGTSQRAIAWLAEQRPAAVLITGDFIYHASPDPEPEITTVIDLLQPLITADIPIYAVLGNHDYGLSAKTAAPEMGLANQLEQALEAAGVNVLLNEAIALESGDSQPPLHLVAVDSRWADQADIDQALAAITDDDPRIVMMHNPDSYAQFPAHTAPLALAGHTHGGQVRIPGLPQWSWLRLVQGDRVYADGWARGFGTEGNHLYVNSGIGMSILPIRLFCPPEVTLFTLTP